MTATTPETTVETLPYKNPDLPASERIADLLSRMTLEEKVGQMMQLDARGGDLDELIVNKHVGSILHTSPEDLPRAVETVNTKTRLGIPLVIGDDCIHGYSFWPGATIFPSQLGMALSWDPKAVEAAGRATAEEVSSTGVHWTFSPVLCIARDTRWGRVDETFGEDPMLIGEMASAMVKGYQGGAQAGETLPKDAILACAKHFAGYSETQGGRDASEADLSHRKLESWFLPPFERIAKEGCGTFMLGYESIEGVPVTFNKWLLTDKLRGAWKYNGTLITDWDNVGRSVWEQKVKPDYVHAAADAVKAGNDLVMTTPGFYDGAIEAVHTGLLDESLIDEAVAAAREADLIVAVVGDVVQLVGETCSTATLELLGGQNALLDALADVSRETGKPMVTVLVSSKPQVLPRSIVGDSGVLAGRCNDPKSGAGSILWAPNPGMEGGQAIAEIILGEVNPSGRLPITFPCHAGQLPVYYNQIRGQHGNRYADLTQDPAFAFGEGEGYTTFAYGEPTIVGGASNADGTFAQTDTVHAEIALTNTGRRAGTEVVQAYVGDVVTSYSWADRELKAFRRVTLEPGETATVVFDIPVCDCTIADADANRIVEPGEFELLIGHSSRRDDLKRTTFTVA